MPLRLIDIPAWDGSTDQSVYATLMIKRWKVQESIVKADGVTANSPVGLFVQGADAEQTGGFFPSATSYVQLPAPSTTNEPGEFPNVTFPFAEDASFHGPYGKIVGCGPQPNLGVPASANGSLIFKVHSASLSNGTTIQVEEMP